VWDSAEGLLLFCATENISYYKMRMGFAIMVGGGDAVIASQSCFLFGLFVSVQGWQFDC
ncbi:hypothetical protein J1N35_039216, partial [Gossypium stocksii]